jgi:hypothetical protein
MSGWGKLAELEIRDALGRAGTKGGGRGAHRSCYADFAFLIQGCTPMMSRQDGRRRVRLDSRSCSASLPEWTTTTKSGRLILWQVLRFEIVGVRDCTIRTNII